MINKLLIANRGEIACRVIRTAKLMGIETVAIYSEVDRAARHVAMADEALPIGAAPATASYLVHSKIIAAAQTTNADAIHPGYGFLSENAQFAQACADAGIAFVGPPPAAIEAMGSKSQAKTLMEAAGVPLLPGFHDDSASSAALKAAAIEIGFPVLLKAVAGGGGKGMRIVESAATFDAELAAAQREAASAFGNDRMLVEKYLAAPRHVELQVFADQNGNVVHLFDRDCSIQRRYQKIIEEAPAPGLQAEMREAMAQAAINAARAIQYSGAGTIEFLVDADRFYFMEMNTRLQVEHPVTEMITGVDLVEWQLRVAAGEPLPLRQSDISCHGHAVEARVYAEDADNSFLPTTGVIETLQWPSSDTGTRVDHGIRAGDQIGIHYDPMLAKVVAHGDTRRNATRRLLRALNTTSIGGVTTNLGFLEQALASQEFANAQLSTGFLQAPLTAATPTPSRVVTTCGALALWWVASRTSTGEAWNRGDTWRINLPATQLLRWQQDGESKTARLTIDPVSGRPTRISLIEDEVELQVVVTAAGFNAEIAGNRWPCTVVVDTDRLSLRLGNARYAIQALVPSTAIDEDLEKSNLIVSPMSARVLSVAINVGDQVQAGTPLIVIEAMKMEQTLRAPAAAKVTACHVGEGDLVTGQQQLIELAFDETHENNNE